MNISSTQTNTSPSIETASCCQRETPQHTKWHRQVDIICRIAIGTFGAMIAPMPLLISFSIGMIVGLAYATSRYMKNKPMYPDGQSKPVCAQGYMDFLSGMRFPPTIGTLGTTAFIAAHMRHDPQFYAPFCGLFLGFWIGREGAALAHHLAGRVYTHFTPPPRHCCH